MNYTAPDVYINDVVSGSNSIVQLSSSVGCLIGTTPSGPVGVPTKVTSWTEFVEKFANGLDTPFMANQYLSYSVYGFFQNGGSELYVLNIKKSGQKATATLATSKLVCTALYEGAWANGAKVTIEKNDAWTSTNLVYDITVEFGDNTITVEEATFATALDMLNGNVQLSQWFVFSYAASASALDEENATLSGGSEGNTLADADYVNSLTKLDILEDITLVGIPGQTSSTVNDALILYCTEHEEFPMLDMPMASTVDATKAYRKTLDAFTGALTYPWGKVNDPLTGTLKLVPSVGHAMGVYSRTIDSESVAKAPAGVNAVVRGFVELEKQLSATEIGILNPLGVICITARSNSGIVIWGARSLNSSDKTMRYVTDGLLNLNIKRSLYAGTQFAVFERNDEKLWGRIDTACRAFLENLRLQGCLKGTAEEAYFVVVNSTNNTPQSIENGYLNIDIGYAPVKPAEFVVIRLAHSIVSE